MNVLNRSVVQRGGLLISALVVLMTAGCFRPASDAPQQTIPSDTPAVQSTVLPPTQDTGGQTSSTVVFEIVTPDATITPSEPPALSTLPQSFQSVPTLTPSLSADQLQPSATVDNGSSTAFGFSGTPTIIFITPGNPLGFVTIESPTATLTLSVDEMNTLAAITPSPTDDGSGRNLPATVTPENACVYVVQSGDTLYQIAIDQSVPASQLRALNTELSGANPILQIGQQLRMPRPGCPDYIAPTATEGSAAATTPNASGAPEGSGTLYTVQPGDTLYAIAQHFGTTVSAIVQVNNLPDANHLSIGQQLVIPVTGGGG